MSEVELSWIDRMKLKYIIVDFEKGGKKTELLRILKSFDGRVFFLREGKRIPTGYFATYECCFHDDITAQGETLEECRANLAVKVNLMIERRLVEKEEKRRSG